MQYTIKQNLKNRTYYVEDVDGNILLSGYYNRALIELDLKFLTGGL